MTQPLAPPPPSLDPQLDRWMRLMWARIQGALASAWTTMDFTGSNLTDIATRNHNDLQNKQGGSGSYFYHLTAAEHAALGTGGTHNELSGLQGGLARAFQSNAFQMDAFQAAEQYHLTAAEAASLAAGYNGTLTTASLVGKTVTIENGVIVSIA